MSEQLRVSGTNWRYLNAMKKPGESFDDVLSRLITEHDYMAFVGGDPGEELPDDDAQTLTPASITRITLNPKVGGEPTDLCCPECDEVIEAWSGPGSDVVEYRCGCEDLRHFRVRGEGDD